MIMKKIKIGLIGYGTIGANHAKYLSAGEVQNAELTAICDPNPAQIERSKKDLAGKISPQYFNDVQELIKSGCVDGILICVPHYEHPDLIVAGLENNLHVLCEKPVGVYTKNIRTVNAVAAKSKKVFGIMFNQRTNPIHKKLREMIETNELGEIKRTNWIITTWYRSQSYYDAGGWRASWAGEGGGVLLNQCPHQLDLWQWICGMPKRVLAFCGFGKYHNIEVEDDVTAYVEYENGATGVFITTTGETPGSNRFEIAGDMGKITMENGKLVFCKTAVSERQFNREFKGGFGSPANEAIEINIEGENPEHKGITQNWVDSILTGSPLLAPGVEGINSLELSNAMLLSSWTDDWVDLPIDDDLFYEKLQKKIKTSKFKKETNNLNMNAKGTF